MHTRVALPLFLSHASLTHLLESVRPHHPIYAHVDGSSTNARLVRVHSCNIARLPHLVCVGNPNSHSNSKCIGGYRDHTPIRPGAGLRPRSIPQVRLRVHLVVEEAHLVICYQNQIKIQKRRKNYTQITHTKTTQIKTANVAADLSLEKRLRHIFSW